MDLAKAIAVLAATKGTAEDYLGLYKGPGPGLTVTEMPIWGRTAVAVEMALVCGLGLIHSSTILMREVSGGGRGGLGLPYGWVTGPPSRAQAPSPGA